jgi:hypothetical protein
MTSTNTFYLAHSTVQVLNPTSLSAETVAVLSSDQNLLTHHKALKYILKNLPKVKWVVWVFAIAP